MKLGYNTNGFAHHRLEDALAILADLGYQSVALTLDYQHLEPLAEGWERRTQEVHGWLEKHKLDVVVETGARFILDPRRKHQPTLLDPDAKERARRRQFLVRSADIARRLGSPLVSLWSGTPVSDEPRELLIQRLADELHLLLEETEKHAVRLAFEPEPGMLIATLDDFGELQAAIRSTRLGLTVDLGHLFCQLEEPIPTKLKAWKPFIWNIHLEDMRRGIHEHLAFGDGEMDFPLLLKALQQIGYTGGVHIELSRHSHDAVRVAGESRAFLLAAGFPA